MKNKIFLIFLLVVNTTTIFAQSSGKLYLSSAGTGKVYDITGTTPSTVVAATPAPITVPAYFAGTTNAGNVSNLAIGYDAAQANQPLVFMHSNTTAGTSPILKDGVSTGNNIPNVTNGIGGLGTNNVLGNSFGNVYGFNLKNLYLLYPTVSAAIPIAGDAIWSNTGGNTSTVFASDTFYDYENNIYTIVQNLNGGVYTRYLYKIAINAGATAATATQVTVISGPVGTRNATTNTSTTTDVGNIRGTAYLNGFVFTASGNGNDQALIYRVNISTGASTYLATLDGTGFGSGNIDLASVDYFVPFTFNCGGMALQGATPYMAGTSSTRTLRIPVSNIYGPGNYVINVIGTDFTNPAYSATVTTTTTFIDVPLTYNGTGGIGSRTLSVNLSGSTTACTLSTFIDGDTDGDGVFDSEDLDDDNDGILDSTEGLCATTTDTSLDYFDNSLGATPTVNGNNVQTTNPYNGWTAQNLNATPTNLPNTAFNIVRVDGTGYSEGPDTAHSGSQYLDINGADANIYKQFTFTNPTVMSASAWFSNRATTAVGYTGYTTRIELLKLNTVTGLYETFNQGNLLTFTKAIGHKQWYQSAMSNVVLSAGTYRIRMFVADYGHVDTISYCFSTDTDGDGIPNHLDADSDGDGCTDALEGSETVRYTQVYPLTFATAALRGQIRVLADGVTFGTPAQVISTVATANGVPLLVNNSANNTGSVAGVADNTDGTADVGQDIGLSQNNLQQDVECNRCFRPANTTVGTTLATTHGITALSRAGTTATDWPGKIKGAYTVIDAKTKGFVVNRVPFNNGVSPAVPVGMTAANFVQGMMLYDTTNNCLKIYDNTNTWRCLNTQTCDNFN